jgi:hypothetical protein
MYLSVSQDIEAMPVLTPCVQATLAVLGQVCSPCNLKWLTFSSYSRYSSSSSSSSSS